LVLHLAVVNSDDCYDVHDTEECQAWAGQDGGECLVNPEWMVQNCKWACKACGCVNLNDQWSEVADCDAWAERGECESNPDWMLVRCARSCGACSDRVEDEIIEEFRDVEEDIVVQDFHEEIPQGSGETEEEIKATKPSPEVLAAIGVAGIIVLIGIVVVCSRKNSKKFV